MNKINPFALNCTSELSCTQIRNFSVTRGQHEILKDVNLHIHCGDLTAIIGANGAGKTTLLRAVLGEVPHSGELLFLARKHVPQKLELDGSSPTTVYDLFAAALSKPAVWFFHPKKTRRMVLESLARADAEHLIVRRLGALSGGELQRVLLALALHPVPDLLLLAEPVSGVDMSGLQLFYKTVSDLRRSYDMSGILVSHDLNLVAQYADRVVLLNNKTVECVGTPEEVFSDQRTKDVFGLNLMHPLEGSAQR